MASNYVAADNSQVDELMELIGELRQIREEIVRVERSFECKTQPIQNQHSQSASNFLHYLALRQRDIRPLQEKLARFGLSSLGRCESHVLANLDALLKVLAALARAECGLPDKEDDGFGTGRYALEHNTLALLGGKPSGRDVRIMVTMPSEAATDYPLVRDLIDAGMDCMRINCAHDSQDAWATMVENLRRAKAELYRDCRLLMDLPGPKLRTVPIEMLPGIVKRRPRRNRYGRVIEPARIWLASKEKSSSCPSGADVHWAVSQDWLEKLQPGETIKFLDARGLSRSMDVKQILENGCWVESGKTAYVVDGTLLQVMRAEKGKGISAEASCIDGLPPARQPIRLETGDIFILTSRSDPGRPAVCDANGKLIQPPSVSVTPPEIFPDVHAGESIWFDDGKIGGVIRSVKPDEIALEITQARTKGENLWADKGINLPDSKLKLPALTEEDIERLPFIVAHADLVGYSFVRSESDIVELQGHLKRLGGDQLGIVLKIETRQPFEEHRICF